MSKFGILAIAMLWSFEALGAVGCDLNDPDRDVKRFFPQSSGYQTAYMSVQKSGGEPLYENMQKQLGDNFNGIYEKIDVPYTVYTILQNDKVVGYIHGVNQKGKYGGMQVFLILNTDGTIADFYFQKLTSRNAKELRSAEFANQFKGLSLEDFTAYNVVEHKAENGSKVGKIKNPSPDNIDDFYAALRGTKKNLILMDNLVFHPYKTEDE